MLCNRNLYEKSVFHLADRFGALVHQGGDSSKLAGWLDVGAGEHAILLLSSAYMAATLPHFLVEMYVQRDKQYTLELTGS